MINQQYDYCNFGGYSVMREILAKAFLVRDFLPVENAYNSFRQQFFNENDDGVVKVKRMDLRPLPTDKVFLESQFLNEDFTVGVDLPVMISNRNFDNGKCIFIVGEDPLRDEKKFVDERKNLEIPLSTPFATHHNGYRNKNGRLYWEFSFFLLELGYKIYYTDLKKIWIKKYSSKAKLNMPDDLFEKFEQCLEDEVNKFKPSIIITFGKPAKISMQKLNSKMQFSQQVVSFIHPTFTARRHWKQILQGSNKKDLLKISDEAVLNYMKDQVSSALSKDPMAKLIA